MSNSQSFNLYSTLLYVDEHVAIVLLMVFRSKVKFVSISAAIALLSIIVFVIFWQLIVFADFICIYEYLSSGSQQSSNAFLCVIQIYFDPAIFNCV